MKVLFKINILLKQWTKIVISITANNSTFTFLIINMKKITENSGRRPLELLRRPFHRLRNTFQTSFYYFWLVKFICSHRKKSRKKRNEGLRRAAEKTNASMVPLFSPAESFVFHNGAISPSFKKHFRFYGDAF